MTPDEWTNLIIAQDDKMAGEMADAILGFAEWHESRFGGRKVELHTPALQAVYAVAEKLRKIGGVS